MVDDDFVSGVVSSIKLDDECVYVLTSHMKGYCFLYRKNKHELHFWIKQSLNEIFGDVKIRIAICENDVVFCDEQVSLNRLYDARLRRTDVMSFLSILNPCAEQSKE